ncbi:MAG: GNAT family N-acetyltransferase [Thiotrichaceae bacterium IS1]|nr:MAG: GNAT family N-acetyltransferase [Thiotrichaceae bacterium IS1]
MEVRVFQHADKLLWDQFVKQSKNGTFLFERDYMDYHADRFTDCSLMIYQRNQLIALLPAHRKDNILYSHYGLTYGGFITDSGMTTPKMLDIFAAVFYFLTTHQIKKLIYKTIPSIYHQIPAEEDRYALFVHKAKLFRRDVLSIVQRENRLPFQERRQRSITKATKNKVQIQQTNDFESFWNILVENLQTKYNTQPVHTLEEIELLHGRFPVCIKLFAAYHTDKMVAGVVIYESELVAHVQYISSSEEGRKIGALDLLFSYLLELFLDKKHFDFGISNENNGFYLNKGLIEQKEGFGARAMVHDFYELDV